jgi:hypothetical protein
MKEHKIGHVKWRALIGGERVNEERKEGEYY